MKTSLLGALGGIVLVGALAFAAATAAAPPTPDFNRDVRPILSNHCFKCHGPDDKQRAAGFRLDMPLSKAKQAEVLKRITATDDALQMPPPTANKPLSDAKRQTLRAWIAGGAKVAAHWAFLPPKRAALPAVPDAAWAKNPIDRFVWAKMAKSGLTPEPEADKTTLIRRVSLDLIGLPPTPEQVDAFLADRAPDAYERLVDRLLASPRYGERWARPWLDLARYSDTNGYEKDRPRSIWPYRDWVIDAFNADMPFDRFTIAQIAGDMLPNATDADRIATGFHRNTMLNEEGGADPLEYRFHAMVDRVATTGTTWLGLTVGCAQCHTHKFDPIPHRDYYKMMALLDNADEPSMEISRPEIAQKRAAAEREIAEREAGLADRFPIPQPIEWKTPTTGVAAKTASGATAETRPDASIRIAGTDPDKDVYTVTIPGDGAPVTAVRVEALTDAGLGGDGPGRTPHGNFVLTEITATANTTPVRFARAEADFAQDGFPPANAIDGKPNTGWAISGPGKWNVDRTLTLFLDKPITVPAGTSWTFTLAQNYGGHHTLGRFRIGFAHPQPDPDPRPIAERRRARLDAALDAWKKPLESKAVRWSVLKPTRATANVPVLQIQPDDSILSTSDITKHDVYDVDFAPIPAGTTALRIEVLPDKRLPGNGPGRVYYEGAAGDFFFSELTATLAGQPVKFNKAVASFGNAAPAIDGDPQSGWSINGGQGRAHTAVFVFEKPLATAGPLALQMLFERYYASSLGRFRVSFTTDPNAGGAALMPDVEAVFRTPEAQRTPEQRQTLLNAFLQATPELASERDAIAALRRALPALPTTLVFQERPAANPRTTFLRHRGEFLQPEEAVKPGVLSVLPPLPKGAPANRLSFARWLVSRENPLTARVTVNRQWALLFGQGIVRSTQDFGYQGDPPTHPELLDWLAVEFMERGWSLKKLNRLIVTSRTYRQSSRTPPQKRAKDPENRLLARGPRVRLEAELIRDATLTASGLLSPKMFGPSVFPPQPPGVTTEGAYGPLAWNVSDGEDRYRRGLYTFSKRTAPYAMAITFDAPTGDATCPRREVSNTPLQALTLLNDAVFVESAQALGARIAARPGLSDAKAAYLFRRCVTRPPTWDELAALTAFYEQQKARLARKELDAARLAGPSKTTNGDDPIERAAWTVTARAVLNLDEAIVKR